MDLLYAFIIAVILLGLIPGPNVGVIVGLSLAKGWRTGLMAVSGTTAGLAIQLIVVSFITSALIEQIANSLFFIRWVGVGYLVFLAISALKTTVNEIRESREEGLCTNENGGKSIDEPDELIINQRISLKGFFQGLIVAIINPKTFLFNAAFLPQFIEPTWGQTVLEQFMLLSLLYLLILAAIDCSWVFFASFMAKLLKKYKGYWGVFSAACFLSSATIIAVMRR